MNCCTLSFNVFVVSVLLEEIAAEFIRKLRINRCLVPVGQLCHTCRHNFSGDRLKRKNIFFISRFTYFSAGYIVIVIFQIAPYPLIWWNSKWQNAQNRHFHHLVTTAMWHFDVSVCTRYFARARPPARDFFGGFLAAVACQESVLLQLVDEIPLQAASEIGIAPWVVKAILWTKNRNLMWRWSSLKKKNVDQC